MVEIVLQNNPASSFNGNGDYTETRTGQEQHPFHLHGYHFWVRVLSSLLLIFLKSTAFTVLYLILAPFLSLQVMGGANGTYPGASGAAPFLNTEDPPYRDTSSILPNSYMVLRFVADNPGAWMFHCHVSAALPAC